MLTTSRREFVIASSATIAAWTALQSSILAHAFPSRPGETSFPGSISRRKIRSPRSSQTNFWEELNSWITPNEQFFSISHFDRPVIDASSWKLEVDGLVKRPLSLTLDELKHGHGRRLSSRSNAPAIMGSRSSPAASATPAGRAHRSPRSLKKQEFSRTGSRWCSGALMSAKIDVRDMKFKQNFARSMSLEDAMSPDNILCYEMNGSRCRRRTAFR